MKTVVEMWHKVWPDSGAFVRASAQDLERFAALVRADEREQCLHAAEVAASLLNDPIAAIRARSNT